MPSGSGSMVRIDHFFNQPITDSPCATHDKRLRYVAPDALAGIETAGGVRVQVGDGLAAVVDMQLLEHMLHMLVHRGGGYPELGGDLAVGPPAAQLFDHLLLSWRQPMV